MLSQIRIVLVNTSHPGNIGAAARAIKTMGLEQLFLVNPLSFPHEKATEMASGALDILENATQVNSLDEAIADCHLIIGTSARSRALPWPMLSPRELAEKTLLQSKQTEIAILFGREQSGLTNEELQRCHFHVQIPSNPHYSSLNIAAAVQVMAYELYVAHLQQNKANDATECLYVNHAEMSAFYQHLERVLVNIDFLNPVIPRKLMPKLRRLFNRARLEVSEMNILRGILGMIERRK